MNKSTGILLLLFFSGVLLLCGQQQNKSTAYQAFYTAAENYYNTDNPTDFTDSLALVNYQKVIRLLDKQKLHEPVVVDCYTKSGILYQAKNNDSSAISSFSKANEFRKTAPSLPDSLFFQPVLFTGASYYSLNNYDSALYFFKAAEQIVNKYKRLPEVERLYNKIGALYYQTGNYRQSINYFNKSINLLNPADAGYTDFLVQYKTNLGASYVKLKDYNKAMEIYESLLPLKTASRAFVLHNIGNIYLEKGEYAKALKYLVPLEYNHQLKLVDLARIYIKLDKNDSAKFYLDSALAENKNVNGLRKNITQGLALKYYGDWELARNNTAEAINYYQRSIIQSDPDFFEEDVTKNPTQFNGLHSSFNLFACLIAKAEAFTFLYNKEKDIGNLAAAVDAYKAAFNLAQYVERFLDTDEARQFLKENVEDAYSGAVETAINAFEVTGKKEYLEQAFVFSEASKASILQVNRQQLQIEQIPEIPQELVHEERNIKANIARLILQAAAIADSFTIEQTQLQISNLEIKLSKVQEKLNENPRYNQLRYNSAK
ncbi:MAG: tetratricopeptide repeat protein, partial [Ferruginibacter sp.]